MFSLRRTRWSFRRRIRSVLGYCYCGTFGQICRNWRSLLINLTICGFLIHVNICGILGHILLILVIWYQFCFRIFIFNFFVTLASIQKLSKFWVKQTNSFLIFFIFCALHIINWVNFSIGFTRVISFPPIRLLLLQSFLVEIFDIHFWVLIEIKGVQIKQVLSLFSLSLHFCPLLLLGLSYPIWDTFERKKTFHGWPIWRLNPVLIRFQHDLGFPVRRAMHADKFRNLHWNLLIFAKSNQNPLDIFVCQADTRRCIKRIFGQLVFVDVLRAGYWLCNGNEKVGCVLIFGWKCLKQYHVVHANPDWFLVMIFLELHMRVVCHLVARELLGWILSACPHARRILVLQFVGGIWNPSPNTTAVRISPTSSKDYLIHHDSRTCIIKVTIGATCGLGRLRARTRSLVAERRTGSSWLQLLLAANIGKLNQSWRRLLWEDACIWWRYCARKGSGQDDSLWTAHTKVVYS